MTPWYIATERFTPANGAAWDRFVDWSGLAQLEDVVSLDPMICPPLNQHHDVPPDYWDHIVSEDFMLDFFVDLPFLLECVDGMDEYNLLCVFRNPEREPSPPDDGHGWTFCGYDLVDRQHSASALTNCGGFPDAFADTELNGHGLLTSRARALEVQAALRAFYPDEPHADCHAWAIFRAAAGQNS